jgi:hypothetical protein
MDVKSTGFFFVPLFLEEPLLEAPELFVLFDVLDWTEPLFLEEARLDVPEFFVLFDVLDWTELPVSFLLEEATEAAVRSPRIAVSFFLLEEATEAAVRSPRIAVTLSSSGSLIQIGSSGAPPLCFPLFLLSVAAPLLGVEYKGAIATLLLVVLFVLLLLSSSDACSITIGFFVDTPRVSWIDRALGSEVAVRPLASILLFFTMVILQHFLPMKEF